MTSASLKQWVVILLLPKLDRTHKNYLTPEIWEEMHSRETFYGTLIFQQSSMICIGRYVGGHALYLVRCLIVTFRCAINVAISYFQHFPWSLRAKFVSESGAVIHNFKNQFLVMWPETDFLILNKWCGFEKPKHYYFI